MKHSTEMRLRVEQEVKKTEQKTKSSTEMRQRVEPESNKIVQKTKKPMVMRPKMIAAPLGTSFTTLATTWKEKISREMVEAEVVEAEVVEAEVVGAEEDLRLLEALEASVVEAEVPAGETMMVTVEAEVGRLRTRERVSIAETWRRSAKGRGKVKVSGVRSYAKVFTGLVNLREMLCEELVGVTA